MQPRTILFPVFTEQSIEEVRQALEACKEIGAHLSVLAFAHLPPVPAATELVVLSDTWGPKAEEAKTALARTVQEIGKIITDEGASADVRGLVLSEIAMESAIAEQALYCDLSLISRSFLYQFDFGEKIVGAILLRTGKPIFFAEPYQFKALEADRILVAWDGEKPASVAVTAAMHWMKSAKQVDGLVLNPKADKNGSGEAIGWDLATYLSRHDIEISMQFLNVGGKPIADAILDFAQIRESELIVMGGYGHSRFREKLFGGTTRKMLQQSSLPILIAH